MLEEFENVPENKGDLYNHQTIFSRFMSSNTIYNRLLLLHAMGSGKTCTAVSVCEKNKRGKKYNKQGHYNS